MIVVTARKAVLATSRTASDAEVRGSGQRRRRAVDDRPIRREEDRERIGIDERDAGGMLLEDSDLVERLEAVQARRQEPPQAQHVADDVAEVAEEDVAGRDQEGAAPA